MERARVGRLPAAAMTIFGACTSRTPRQPGCLSGSADLQRRHARDAASAAASALAARRVSPRARLPFSCSARVGRFAAVGEQHHVLGLLGRVRDRDLVVRASSASYTASSFSVSSITHRLEQGLFDFSSASAAARCLALLRRRHAPPPLLRRRVAPSRAASPAAATAASSASVCSTCSFSKRSLGAIGDDLVNLRLGLLLVLRRCCILAASSASANCAARELRVAPPLLAAAATAEWRILPPVAANVLEPPPPASRTAAPSSRTLHVPHHRLSICDATAGASAARVLAPPSSRSRSPSASAANCLLSAHALLLTSARAGLVAHPARGRQTRVLRTSAPALRHELGSGASSAGRDLRARHVGDSSARPPRASAGRPRRPAVAVDRRPRAPRRRRHRPRAGPAARRDRGRRRPSAPPERHA